MTDPIEYTGFGADVDDLIKLLENATEVSGIEMLAFSLVVARMKNFVDFEGETEDRKRTYFARSDARDAADVLRKFLSYWAYMLEGRGADIAGAAQRWATRNETYLLESLVRLESDLEGDRGRRHKR